MRHGLGLALGRGEWLADILASRSAVAEGVATAPALIRRATAAGAAMPVCAAVAVLLDGRTTIPEAMQALLARPLRDE